MNTLEKELHEYFMKVRQEELSVKPDPLEEFFKELLKELKK